MRTTKLQKNHKEKMKFLKSFFLKYPETSAGQLWLKVKVNMSTQTVYRWHHCRLVPFFDILDKKWTKLSNLFGLITLNYLIKSIKYVYFLSFHVKEQYLISMYAKYQVD